MGPIESMKNSNSHKFIVQKQRILHAQEKNIIFRFFLRQLGSLIVSLAISFSRRNQERDEEFYSYALTGRFESFGWMRAHLAPLSRAKRTRKIYVVTDRLFPPIDSVEYIVVPSLLASLFGRTAARLIWFTKISLKHEVNVLGGFHLLLNGLVVLLLGGVTRKKTVYFCVGGWSEIYGGGAYSGTPIFGGIGINDRRLENKLIQAVKRFDLVVTMGNGAKLFLSQRGVLNILVNPGGIDDAVFCDRKQDKNIDLIIVARIDPIKRIDLFIELVRKLIQKHSSLSAVIIGDGNKRSELQHYALKNKISQHIQFAGHQNNIASWLNIAKIFILTSDSEGVPLSIMEALMVGLPVVATNVGDVEDIIEDGYNGYLVRPGQVNELADRVELLLSDQALFNQMRHNVRQSAKKLSVTNSISRWDTVSLCLSKKS